MLKVPPPPRSTSGETWRHTVSRHHDEPGKLRVDDSKRLNQGRLGRWRLETAATAAIKAVTGEAPESFDDWCNSLKAGTRSEVELEPWLLGNEPQSPSFSAPSSTYLPERPFEGAAWKLTAVRSVVVGPRRFNDSLARVESKARVHFEAFARLLRWAWETSTTEALTHLRVDKHGGRHFYYAPLCESLPEAWIKRGKEGPSGSSYELSGTARKMCLEFVPRADAEDGLVALASVISKALRERWMDAFNAYWLHHCPGLRPTAGYPVDAARFRREIEPIARKLNMPAHDWWRLK